MKPTSVLTATSPAAETVLTVVPSLTLFYFAQPALVVLPLHAPGLQRQIFVVRRAERSLSSAAQALYQRVMDNKPGPALGAAH